eukprot:3934484-Rhodomonas_salina.3
MSQCTLVARDARSAPGAISVRSTSFRHVKSRLIPRFSSHTWITIRFCSSPFPFSFPILSRSALFASSPSPSPPPNALSCFGVLGDGGAAFDLSAALENASTGVWEDAEAAPRSCPTALCRVALMRGTDDAENGRFAAAVEEVVAKLLRPSLLNERRESVFPSTRPAPEPLRLPSLCGAEDPFAELPREDAANVLYSRPGRFLMCIHRCCKTFPDTPGNCALASSSHHFDFFRLTCPPRAHAARSSSSSSSVHPLSIAICASWSRSIYRSPAYHTVAHNEGACHLCCYLMSSNNCTACFSSPYLFRGYATQLTIQARPQPLK